MMCLCSSRTFKNSGIRRGDTQEEPFILSDVFAVPSLKLSTS